MILTGCFVVMACANNNNMFFSARIPNIMPRNTAHGNHIGLSAHHHDQSLHIPTWNTLDATNIIVSVDSRVSGIVILNFLFFT